MASLHKLQKHQTKEPKACVLLTEGCTAGKVPQKQSSIVLKAVTHGESPGDTVADTLSAAMAELDQCTPEILMPLYAPTTKPAGPEVVLMMRGLNPSSSAGMPKSDSLPSYTRIRSL